MSYGQTFRALLVAIVGTVIGAGFVAANGPHPEQAMTFFYVAGALVLVTFAVLGVEYLSWRKTRDLLGVRLEEGNWLWAEIMPFAGNPLPPTFETRANEWMTTTRAVVLHRKGTTAASVFDNITGSRVVDSIWTVTITRDWFRIRMANLMFLIEQHQRGEG